MFNGLISLMQALVARVQTRDESGQALVEYGLLVGLIAVICVVAVTALGVNVAAMLQSVADAL
jgi:pilus assembly protein Flp/PilA